MQACSLLSKYLLVQSKWLLLIHNATHTVHVLFVCSLSGTAKLVLDRPCTCHKGNIHLVGEHGVGRTKYFDSDDD